MASGRDTPILDRYRDEERLPRVYPLVLDGVYRMAGSVPVFQEARAPTVEELHALLAKIIARLMRLLTRQGVLIVWRHPHLEGERQTRSGGCVECRRERKLFANYRPSRSKRSARGVGSRTLTPAQIEAKREQKRKERRRIQNNQRRAIGGWRGAQ